MTEEDAFLADIVENPEDYAPRLVYADWLEENGRPERAEFIRVQCELARLPEGSPRRQELEGRERELLREYGEDWAGPVHGVVESYAFRRGFVEEVQLAADAFLARADDILGAAPLRCVRLSPGRWAPEILLCPQLRRLAALDLTLNDLGDEGAQGLAACEHLANLSVLDLSGCGLGEAGVRALFSSPNLPRLRVLLLTGNSLSECWDVPGLFADWRLHRLAELSLQGTFIDVRGQGLVRVDRLAQLSTLDLSENDLHFEDEDAEALASCEYLAGLATLHLGHDNIGREGAGALASSRHLGRLTTLGLRANFVEAEGVRRLMSSPLVRLRSLDVSCNQIGDPGANALASSPGLANVLRLGLGYNQITDAGARALAASPYADGLVRLDLCRNDISEACQRELKACFGGRVIF